MRAARMTSCRGHFYHDGASRARRRTFAMSVDGADASLKHHGKMAAAAIFRIAGHSR